MSVSAWWLWAPPGGELCHQAIGRCCTAFLPRVCRGCHLGVLSGPQWWGWAPGLWLSTSQSPISWAFVLVLLLPLLDVAQVLKSSWQLPVTGAALLIWPSLSGGVTPSPCVAFRGPLTYTEVTSRHNMVRRKCINTPDLQSGQLSGRHWTGRGSPGGRSCPGLPRYLP